MDGKLWGTVHPFLPTGKTGSGVAEDAGNGAQQVQRTVFCAGYGMFMYPQIVGESL
jgi:hypothetical protein